MGKTSAVTGKRVGTEVTAVCEFPRPSAWGSFGSTEGDQAEINAAKASQWSPTTDYFQLVAETPGSGLTQIFRVDSVGSLLGAILTQDSSGSPRPDGSLRRFNIISHGTPSPPTIGIKGTVSATGSVTLGTPIRDNPSGPADAPLAGTAFNIDTIDWLNDRGRSVRDDCRKKFMPTGELVLFLCNGGVGASMLLAIDLARCLDVAVRAYREEVGYHFTFSKTKIINRNLTSKGLQGKQGPGYPCAVAVAAAKAGKHMLPFTAEVPKPAKPAP